MFRLRIAPSPTGNDLHIGNLYTALINWAFARKNKGKFIIRIEDTDRTRYVPGAEERILKTLADYGLNCDESTNKGGPYGPYRQSERLDLYKKYAKELVENGFAYYCFCSRERLAELRKNQKKKKKITRYDRHCLKTYTQEQAKKKVEEGAHHVIRLKIPRGKEIAFNDLVRGKIIFETNNIDDQVLMKSDGYPTYHLAVVVDDHLMKISHIVRAEEWISSTPKHIILYKAFGWKLPIFAHTPILRNPDKSKLSKRKNPVWASWYLKEGYLPEAVLNYLALMGWSHPEQKEIFSLDEFIKVFNLKDLQAVGPAFDQIKLKWINGEYIRRLENEKLKIKLFDFFKGKYSKNLIEKTIPLIKERIKTLKEYDEYCQFFIIPPKEYEKDLEESKELIKNVEEILEKINDWSLKNINSTLMTFIKKEDLKVGKFFMIIRILITGKKVSPPINESMVILGKEECLRRLKKLI